MTCLAYFVSDVIDQLELSSRITCELDLSPVIEQCPMVDTSEPTNRTHLVLEFDVKTEMWDNIIHKGRTMPQGTIKVNASEETIQIGPIGIRFLLTGDDSGGSASVFEFSVPAGERLAAPAHKNDAYEEILYGIEGILTWTVDGTPIEVGPGQALCIPRGAVHRFDNFGSVDVRQLAVISPAKMGPAYFREAAEVISAAAGGPPDRGKMIEVFRRHGMTLVPPPPDA